MTAIDSRSASQIAAEAMEGLDDSLQPIKDESVIVEDDKKVDDKQDDQSKDDKADDKKDEEKGYAIDDVDGEKDDDKPEPKEKEPEKPVDTQYTPEQKYILDNLPVIKVRGVVGDDEKVQEFSVYDPRQLPENFKYLSDREHDIAVKDFGLIEQRATSLQQEFRNQETTKAQKSYKEQEEKADWEDIAAMQKSGDLSLFKVKPTDKDFDNDETAQLIEKVIEFKDEINKKHLETYNAGGPYRHIGFEDAYHKYVRLNPPKKDDKQEQEDKDRKDLARRTRGTNSDAAKGGTKPPILQNKQDIDAYIDSLEF